MEREWSEPSDPSVNLSSKSLKLERLVPLELGRVVLMFLSDATNSASETMLAFARNV